MLRGHSHQHVHPILVAYPDPLLPVDVGVAEAGLQAFELLVHVRNGFFHSNLCRTTPSSQPRDDDLACLTLGAAEGGGFGEAPCCLAPLEVGVPLDEEAVAVACRSGAAGVEVELVPGFVHLLIICHDGEEEEEEEGRRRIG